jgi:invasion protein IalB
MSARSGRVAAIALAAAMLATGAQAQDATGKARVTNGAQFGGWTVTCDAVAVNETVCVLRQRLLRRADQAFLAELLAFATEDGARRFLSARVPNGAHLPSGLVLRAEREGAEPLAFVWQSCGRDLCEALAEVPAGVIEGLEKAERVVMAWRPAVGAEPLAFALPFAGAGEGLAALAAASQP